MSDRVLLSTVITLCAAAIGWYVGYLVWRAERLARNAAEDELLAMLAKHTAAAIDAHTQKHTP